MRITARGRDFIRHFEALRLRPYRDSEGVPTIGWGTTTYPDGRRVAMTDQPITRRQADDYFDIIADRFAATISHALRVTIEPHQFDALMSLAYNAGDATIARSKLVREINARADVERIARQFRRWINRGSPSETGLRRRREQEIELWRDGDYDPRRTVTAVLANAEAAAPQGSDTVREEPEEGGRRRLAYAGVGGGGLMAALSDYLPYLRDIGAFIRENPHLVILALGGALLATAGVWLYRRRQSWRYGAGR